MIGWQVTQPTIHDVAAVAGVSVTTVSHVLNDKGRVDPATRIRVAQVAQVAQRLGYRGSPGNGSGETALAAQLLDQVQPESPDGSAATVAGCIGVAVSLLDNWLSGQEQEAPPGLAKTARLPAGHWEGERAVRDILGLAGKGRVFSSLSALIGRQGGRHVLYGHVPPDWCRGDRPARLPARSRPQNRQARRTLAPCGLSAVAGLNMGSAPSSPRLARAGRPSRVMRVERNRRAARGGRLCATIRSTART